MEIKLKFIIILFLSIGIFYSCVDEKACEKGKKYLKTHETYIILESKPKKRFEDYVLIGKDLYSGTDTTIRLKGRWYETLGKTWNSGDTVIKKKGELIITVRKMDNTVHFSEWTCEDIYLNGKSIRTGRSRPQ